MGNGLQRIVILISKNEEICNSEREVENAIVKIAIVFSAVFVYNTHNKLGKRVELTRKGGVNMAEEMTAFIVWAIVGCIMIGIGIGAYFSKKPVGFWANVKTFPVKDTKGYNRALGKLFVCYGAVFVVLGMPLLCGQNSPYIFLSVVGVMVETIAVMIVYSVRIEKRYREP